MTIPQLLIFSLTCAGPGLDGYLADSDATLSLDPACLESSGFTSAADTTISVFAVIGPVAAGVDSFALSFVIFGDITKLRVDSMILPEGFESSWDLPSQSPPPDATLSVSGRRSNSTCVPVATTQTLAELRLRFLPGAGPFEIWLRGYALGEAAPSFIDCQSTALAFDLINPGKVTINLLSSPVERTTVGSLKSQFKRW